MVHYSAASLDTTFTALSDPTRRVILQRLAAGPRSTSELAAPFAMSLPAVLKHLRVLERAQLVVGEKRGRVHSYRLHAAPMRDAVNWLEEYRAFWETRLDALERHLVASSEKHLVASSEKHLVASSEKHLVASSLCGEEKESPYDREH